MLIVAGGCSTWSHIGLAGFGSYQMVMIADDVLMIGDDNGRRRGRGCR